MFNEVASTDLARVLAELVDTALSDDWSEEAPAMALLWQASADPDDLRIAVKRLERAVEDELRQLVQADGGSYLAVAHSTLTRGPVPELGHSGEGPVRITAAVDHRSESGVLRHPTGATQWFGDVDLPVITLVRSLLWLAPAA